MVLFLFLWRLSEKLPGAVWAYHIILLVCAYNYNIVHLTIFSPRACARGTATSLVCRQHKSLVLGIWTTPKHNKSVDIGKKTCCSIV